MIVKANTSVSESILSSLVRELDSLKVTVSVLVLLASNSPLSLRGTMDTASISS